MKKMVLLVWIAASLVLSGCAFLEKQRDDTAALLNPAKLHGANDKSSAAYGADKIPYLDYYHALSLAQTRYILDSSGGAVSIAESDAELIENYVNEGIGLVDTHCRRWFQRLDDMQRLLAYQEKNVNIISQLGTAMLGIGKASAGVVAAYGALNTAHAGFSENFSAAFLVAPTTSKVREHIETVMRAEADRLRREVENMSFKQVYASLERYAGLCTHAQAREIVNSALNLTKTQLISGTDQAETVVK